MIWSNMPRNNPFSFLINDFFSQFVLLVVRSWNGTSDPILNYMTTNRRIKPLQMGSCARQPQMACLRYREIITNIRYAWSSKITHGMYIRLLYSRLIHHGFHLLPVRLISHHCYHWLYICCELISRCWYNAGGGRGTVLKLAFDRNARWRSERCWLRSQSGNNKRPTLFYRITLRISLPFHFKLMR